MSDIGSFTTHNDNFVHKPSYFEINTIHRPHKHILIILIDVNYSSTSLQTESATKYLEQNFSNVMFVRKFPSTTFHCVRGSS